MHSTAGRPVLPRTPQRRRYRLVSGDVIVTTETEPSDIEAMRRWSADPGFVVMTGGPLRRPTAAQVRSQIARNDGIVSHHMAVRSNSAGRPIGYARTMLDPGNRLITITPILSPDAPSGSPDHVLRALCDWAFGILGVHKVAIRTAATNLPATSALEALPAAYRAEARLVSAIRLLDGTRTDEIRHGVLARDWAETRQETPPSSHWGTTKTAMIGAPVAFPARDMRLEAFGSAPIAAGPYSLETATASDLDLLAAWAEDVRLMSALGNRPARRGRGEIEAFVRSFDGRTAHLRMIRAEGLTVGYCSARIDPSNSNAEVTLAVPDHRAPRRPIMRLVLRHLVDRLFTKIGVERVSAEVMAGNRVMTDFLEGAIRFEGRLVEEILRPDGGRRDALRYGLLKEDWTALRQRGIDAQAAGDRDFTLPAVRGLRDS